ncbi:hypothetical protein V6N13_069315 [Hibiscus sabdariffa]
MPVRDLVSWDAIIYGDQLVGDGLSSLVCLREMVLVGIRPDRQIHAVIMKWGLSYSVTIISNSIIYLYAKCGDLQIARRCFDGMFRKDIVSWNTIITAYAIHGWEVGRCREDQNSYDSRKRSKNNGCCTVEKDYEVHRFVNQDRSNVRVDLNGTGVFGSC